MLPFARKWMVPLMRIYIFLARRKYHYTKTLMLIIVSALLVGKCKAPIKLMVWKTIPLLEDKCVSGTDAVVAIGGLT